MLIAVWVEIVIGNAGFPVPVFAATAFYFFVTYGWERSVLWAGLAAAVLDATLMRSAFPSLAALIPVGMMAALWRRQGDCRSGELQALPGVFVGLLWGMSLVLLEALPGQHVSLALVRRSAALVAVAAGAGCLVMPLVRHLLDSLAAELRFPRYNRVAQGRRLSPRG